MANRQRNLLRAAAVTGALSLQLAFLLLLAAALLLAPAADATALTYRIPAHDKGCFYTWVDHAPKRVGFYFAVQTGGSFDIDYVVTDPKGRVLLKGNKERQGDYVFTGNEVGEYTFCFSNTMSTFADKVVDFEITTENERKPAAEAAKEVTARPESEVHTTAMDEVITRLSASMTKITRIQKYFRTREHRNMATVRSTENRIFYFALLESIMIVTVAVLQVFMVRTFFSGVKRGRV